MPVTFPRKRYAASAGLDGVRQWSRCPPEYLLTYLMRHRLRSEIAPGVAETLGHGAVSALCGGGRGVVRGRGPRGTARCAVARLGHGAAATAWSSILAPNGSAPAWKVSRAGAFA